MDFVQRLVVERKNMLLVLAKGGKEQTSEYTPFVPVRVLDIFNLFFFLPNT